jgi:hypothetical protein
MSLSQLVQAPPPAPPSVDGLLHYRYLPAVNDATRADIETVTMTPAGSPTKTESFFRGTGEVKFLHSSWEQLPTQFQVVNALAALPQIEQRGATLTFQRGAKDLSDVRTLC